MIKTFKFKLLIVSMVLLAIITSITAFSVSYAKWVANDNTTVSGSADVGVWGGDTQDKFTLYQDKDRTTVLKTDNFDLEGESEIELIFSFTVELEPGEKFWFYLNGQDQPVSYPVKDGENLLGFNAEEGCYYSKISDAKLKFSIRINTFESGLWVGLKFD